jgi:hypothetical protein
MSILAYNFHGNIDTFTTGIESNYADRIYQVNQTVCQDPIGCWVNTLPIPPEISASPVWTGGMKDTIHGIKNYQYRISISWRLEPKYLTALLLKFSLDDIADNKSLLKVYSDNPIGTWTLSKPKK